MSWENPSKERMKDVLAASKTIAVVGLSNNPERTSYQIAQAMQDVGYTIIPVNPMVDEVLGEKAYNRLADVPGEIDIINVFRRSDFVLEVAYDALETECTVFWTQQGVTSSEAYDLLKQNDFTVIMDVCIKVAHAVL